MSNESDFAKKFADVRTLPRNANENLHQGPDLKISVTGPENLIRVWLRQFTTGEEVGFYTLSCLVHWSAGGILLGFLNCAADVLGGEQTGHVGEV